MSSPDNVVKTMSDAYSAAVNAGDSSAVAKLFTDDAVRMPPGGSFEVGPEVIRRSEQGYYDRADWSVSFTPRDALAVGDDWVYGIVDCAATITPRSGRGAAEVEVTVAWLFERHDADTWLIKRQVECLHSG